MCFPLAFIQPGLFLFKYLIKYVDYRKMSQKYTIEFKSIYRYMSSSCAEATSHVVTCVKHLRIPEDICNFLYSNCLKGYKTDFLPQLYFRM